MGDTREAFARRKGFTKRQLMGRAYVESRREEVRGHPNDKVDCELGKRMQSITPEEAIRAIGIQGTERRGPQGVPMRNRPFHEGGSFPATRRHPA